MKGNSAIQLIIEMIIQKNLKGLERREVMITSYVKVFLVNKCNSYTYTARYAKLTCTRNVYENSVMKRKKKGFQRRI